MQNCVLSLPYPELSGINPDKRLAMLVNEAYSGRFGALYAVSEYTYYSILLEKTIPMIADLYDCFAQTKLKHFHILGNTILSLGIDPLIKTSIRTATPNVSTELSLCVKKSLLACMDTEEKTMEYLKKIALHTNDKVVTAILKRLVLDCEHHINILNEIATDVSS